MLVTKCYKDFPIEVRASILNDWCIDYLKIKRKSPLYRWLDSFDLDLERIRVYK